MLLYSTMIVYLIKNLVNDKNYVGLTTRNIKVRWYEHVKKSKKSNLSDISLHKDIFLYGKNNFKIEVLKEIIQDLFSLNKSDNSDSIKKGTPPVKKEQRETVHA